MVGENKKAGNGALPALVSSRDNLLLHFVLLGVFLGGLLGLLLGLLVALLHFRLLVVLHRLGSVVGTRPGRGTCNCEDRSDLPGDHLTRDFSLPASKRPAP